MFNSVYKYIWAGDRYYGIKQKSEKQTHFAVTKGGETTYREFFISLNDIGTNICSNNVEILRDFDRLKILETKKSRPGKAAFLKY